MLEKILCIGPQWRGSNAGGMFKAFSRLGHQISIVDENYYIPLNTKSFITRLGSKMWRNKFIKDFNQEVIDQTETTKPTIIFIYKGAFILPQTLSKIKKMTNRSCVLVNFYPDVSFHTHGPLLMETLPLYDQIFTTKSFGIADLRDQLDIENAHYIPHGFDPDIHKPIGSEGVDHDYDVSFIGTWSLHKERILASLIESLPSLNIAIYGSQWNRVNSEAVHQVVRGYPVFGDEYAIAIQKSKINLGLLSERVRGASTGDQITSRTFHIPACRGFMLHQRTNELMDNFIDGEEIATFNDYEEMVQKVKYYLEQTREREQTAMKGYKRAIAEHSLDSRAQSILDKLQGGV